MQTSHHITRISLVIPSVLASQMHTHLVRAIEQMENPPAVSEGLAGYEQLPSLLLLCGWRTEWLLDGSLKLVDYTREAFDPEHDPVLESAVGCVRAGCFIEGYSEDNIQWQIRYLASNKQLVFGQVTFPRDPEWEQHFRSMLILREGKPSDLPQLAALSPRGTAITQEQILVAERGDRIVGFLTYHSEQERTGIITNIATVVNGRRYGYPQALVTSLQQRYQVLLIRITKRDYRRVWKALGFARCPAMFEAGGPGAKEDYRWPAPPQEQAAPAQVLGVLRRQLNDALLGMRAQERLSEQEIAAIQWRFALLDGRWHSLEETARRVGTTREMVRQHQAKALRKLRKHPECLTLLKNYLRLASPPLRLRSSIAWLIQEPDTAPTNLAPSTSKARR